MVGVQAPVDWQYRQAPPRCTLGLGTGCSTYATGTAAAVAAPAADNEDCCGRRRRSEEQAAGRHKLPRVANRRAFHHNSSQYLEQTRGARRPAFPERSQNTCVSAGPCFANAAVERLWELGRKTGSIPGQGASSSAGWFSSPTRPVQTSQLPACFCRTLQYFPERFIVPVSVWRPPPALASHAAMRTTALLLLALAASAAAQTPADLLNNPALKPFVEQVRWRTGGVGGGWASRWLSTTVVRCPCQRCEGIASSTLPCLLA